MAVIDYLFIAGLSSIEKVNAIERRRQGGVMTTQINALPDDASREVRRQFGLAD